ncbi:class I SAM-dependent methyltransferase [Nocardia sp. MW-W600-9]
MGAEPVDDDVEVWRKGDAGHIAADNDSFEAVAASLVLCTVPDQQAALAEIFRVLEPGGVLLFFEHVRSESARMRRMQRVVDATVWPLLNGSNSFRRVVAVGGVAAIPVGRA